MLTSASLSQGRGLVAKWCRAGGRLELTKRFGDRRIRSLCWEKVECHVPRVRTRACCVSATNNQQGWDGQPVGFANSGGLVFGAESAEEIATVRRPFAVRGGSRPFAGTRRCARRGL